MALLLEAGLVVADVQLALADQCRHVLRPQIHLDKPAVLQLADTEADEEVGTQQALGAHSSESSPTTRFGLDLLNLETAPAGGDPQVDHHLADRQSVIGEGSRRLPEVPTPSVGLEHPDAKWPEGIDVPRRS